MGKHSWNAPGASVMPAGAAEEEGGSLVSTEAVSWGYSSRSPLKEIFYIFIKLNFLVGISQLESFFLNNIACRGKGVRLQFVDMYLRIPALHTRAEVQLCMVESLFISLRQYLSLAVWTTTWRITWEAYYKYGFLRPACQARWTRRLEVGPQNMFLQDPERIPIPTQVWKPLL